MRLSRQLILLISLLLILVFIGTLTITVHNTRDYLVTQMQSHAQDTATSLGLSLAPVIGANDQAMMNSMVDAIFDRGYYRDITIRDMSGKTLLQRTRKVEFHGVPAWFVRALPLRTPEARSTITSGWRQVATVEVRSHPGYAYRELWGTTTHTAGWLLALGLAAVVIVIVIVRFVLKPLNALEQQAIAVSQRRFTVQDRLPRTPELRRVVAAMNQMSSQVERMFDSQAELTEKMRARAYEDPVTGLQNRRSLEERLRHMVQTREEFHSGALALVELSGFKAFNDRYGMSRGDALLQVAAEALRQACTGLESFTLARLGGAGFAVLVPNLTPDETQTLAEAIATRLSDLHTGNGEEPAHANTGAAFYNGNQSRSELLSAADMALRAAQRKGPDSWQINSDDNLTGTRVRSASDWKTLLEAKLRDEALVLHYQPVLTSTGEQVLHYEVLVRLIEDALEPVPAAVFMPMAERHGLASQLDRIVVQRIVSTAPRHPAADFAVNLSPASLADTSFVDWLCALLHDNAETARRLTFETTDFGAIARLDALQRTLPRLHETGARFSLDHFGTSGHGFGHLRSLTLDCIKIDGSYIRGIHTKEDNRFFVRALTEIAHGLDIQVVAEYVEEQGDWDTLKTAGVDGVQGNLVGSPKAEF